MAHSISWYGQAFKTFFNKEADIPDDTFKLMLCDDTYTSDIDAHDYKNDITGELSGGGYTAGGVALGSLTWTQTGASNLWTLDAADSNWNPLSATNLRYAVGYCSTPATDATRPVLFLVTLDANQTFTGANFTLSWNASGIVYLNY